MVDLRVREKNSNANGGKENGITTGLPPGSKNCLHTFED
jgi:hypothetical protein